jgi:hypothetical protein
LPVPYANVSLVTSGDTAHGGARNFSYLRVLNTDVLHGGGTTYTSVISSIVTSILSQSVTNYTFQNANNVSFGTAKTTIGTATSMAVTATAGPVARSAIWAAQGVYVASVSPSNPCVYSDWLSGSSGYFGWLVLP